MTAQQHAVTSPPASVVHPASSPGDEADVRAADRLFFASLVRADGAGLARLLDDRFVLVDVLGGSAIPKPDLLEAVTSGLLGFDTVTADEGEPSVRLFGSTALVVGHTRMTGRFRGGSWTADSRYTHVFVHPADAGPWRLVGAQGTRTGALGG
ncbi:nuclear transport factor 2 family protein [Streptomyces sp. NBC_01497]|uniref:nuclear transport factor 2 family protein n=1 Tax=Streptomyces sp. NBC_01497 TaxID=2903885 RepID=UPI002E347B20|nr:nuclear transport factor 2 family protein [Streptomyces sp. NBC_01497]